MRMEGTRDHSPPTAAAFTHPSNPSFMVTDTSLYCHTATTRLEQGVLVQSLAFGKLKLEERLERATAQLSSFMFGISVLLCIFLFVSVVSSSSLLLCLFSLMPMVAKVTGNNSYSHWFSAVLCTIYLCKFSCVCVAKAYLDCIICGCVCEWLLVFGFFMQTLSTFINVWPRILYLE